MATDLSNTSNLTLEQLTGENAPYLYDVALPENISIDPDRDCADLPAVLQERYGTSLERAEQFIQDAMEHQWDD